MGRKYLNKIKEITQKREENTHKTVGRPTRFQTLTPIANNLIEPEVKSKELIILIRQMNKKTKTILTKFNDNIECYTESQFMAYNLIGEERKKAIETIKNEKQKLDCIDKVEELLKNCNK